ncbi:hypothetical protein [Dysgonomonas reticulitermitis]
MKSIAEQYSHEVSRNFGGGYYAVWEPGEPIKLGDIGTLSNNVFKRIDNVMNEPFSLTFETRLDDKFDAKKSFVSQSNVSWKSNLNGKVDEMGSILKDLEAGIVIEFGNKNSTVFEALNISYHSIENQISLQDAVLDFYRKGIWRKDWVIVTGKSVADSATILISNSSNANIEIKASGNVGAGDISIADASLGLSRVSARGLGYQLIAEQGISPTIRLCGVRHRIFHKPVVVQKVQPDNNSNQIEEEISFESIKSPDWTGE